MLTALVGDNTDGGSRPEQNQTGKRGNLRLFMQIKMAVMMQSVKIGMETRGQKTLGLEGSSHPSPCLLQVHPNNNSIAMCVHIESLTSHPLAILSWVQEFSELKNLLNQR